MCYRLLLGCSLLLVCVGCQKQPINLTTAKNEVEAYYASGAFEKEFAAVIEKAKRHFAEKPLVSKPTVVFDIDDTTISDYCHMKEIQFGYIPKLSHEWVLHADACVIRPTKELYDFLKERGYIIIFLTSRKHNEYDATKKNLEWVGISDFEKLIVRTKEEETLLASEYKPIHRKLLTQAGYTIVGCVGDQWSDMSGGYTGYQVKVPNYTYILQ